MNLFKKYNYIVVFIFSLFVCFSFIGFYPIYILDEAKNSEAAREMFATGNWIVPYFNATLRTDKPPFHYFFMMFGYKLFGVNPFGARFFSSLFGALTFLVTYYHVKLFRSQKEAFTVLIVLLSSLFFVQEFHLAVPDPYLIFFITTTLFCFFNFYERGKKIALFFMYACIGFGVLAKGPIAILLPGLIILVFLLLQREFNRKKVLSFSPFLGLLLILLIAIPWYYEVHKATEGVWTKGFFLDHNVNRFSSEKEGHGGLFLVTPLFVILGTLPFSVFIIQAFKKGWVDRKKDSFIFFSFIVSATIIVFFSISSTKLPNYPMPAYPFVAILIGNYLHTVYKEKNYTKFVKWSLISLLILSATLLVGGFIALSIEKQFFDIRFLSLFFIVLVVSAILGLYFFNKKELKKSFYSIAGGWILFGFILFGFIYPKLNKKSPVALSFEYMKPSDNIIAYQRFDSAFPINFKRTFKVYPNLKELDAYLDKTNNVYIITNARNIDSLQNNSNLKLILKQKALFENHITHIFKKE